MTVSLSLAESFPPAAHLPPWERGLPPPSITQISKSRLQIIQSLTLQDGQNDIRNLVVSDDGWLYAHTNTAPTQIIKIATVHMQVSKSIRLLDGEDHAIAGSLGVDGKFLFVGTSTTPAKIIKIRTSSMARAGETDLSVDQGIISELVADWEYVFAACHTSPGTII